MTAATAVQIITNGAFLNFNGVSSLNSQLFPVDQHQDLSATFFFEMAGGAVAVAAGAEYFRHALSRTERRARMTALEKELEAFINAAGFRFFKGRELTRYWRRARGKVSNSVPPRELWPNIIPSLRVLDEFRRRHGSPGDAYVHLSLELL